MSRHTRHRIAIAGALLAALVLLGPGCTTAPPPEDPKIAEEQLRKEAEERQRAAAEQVRLAEEARQAEEQRQVEALMDLFGPVGEPPAAPGSQPPATPAPFVRHVIGAGTPAPAGEATLPYDEAVPPLPPEPELRVAVLSHQAPLAMGQQVAVQIGTHARERIEERLGMAVRVVYVAESSQPLEHSSEVRYRPDFFRAAQTVAQELAAEQWLGPLTEAQRTQAEVDVVVHIGAGYR